MFVSEAGVIVVCAVCVNSAGLICMLNPASYQAHGLLLSLLLRASQKVEIA